MTETIIPSYIDRLDCIDACCISFARHNQLTVLIAAAGVDPTESTDQPGAHPQFRPFRRSQMAINQIDGTFIAIWYKDL